MSKYILTAGDVVDFTDRNTGKVYRGYIDKFNYQRDNLNGRDYLIKFDEPLWGLHDMAWCSRDDLELVRPAKRGTAFTTMSTNTTTQTTTPSQWSTNLKLTDVLQKSSVTKGDRPWMAYYVSSDEFFELLQVAFEDTYGSDHQWHPEDLYINVSCVLEVVSNTLANMVRVKSGRTMQGVKGS